MQTRILEKDGGRANIVRPCPPRYGLGVALKDRDGHGPIHLAQHCPSLKKSLYTKPASSRIWTVARFKKLEV